eukprot:CAMPEP_0206562546 /NCGR_PEP_ID=MMETSP0325_2-20121206/22309_1 /ASSEMBLY_ACC=CAM_ASM_000347 /TAXON_ID=2866 /ORGANISM="Crypthecodinium cohnii, Strain Seligo" /LENGTH=256 /DNA_ID=CAMNT_0054064769 /DNA_START=84 /DNA_END=854 /DNA_ORIENTATION=-
MAEAPTPEMLALESAIRRALIAEGLEAGPKALLASVQAESDEFSGVSIHKFKKVLTKVKAVVMAEIEAAIIEAAKPKVGSKENCPGRHGLNRFITNHSSYCCDTCRCYLPEGAPMWGCRECDWDVCEGRCHPDTWTLADFKSKLARLESQVDEVKAAENIDKKTKLALVETDVKQLEKRVDNTNAQDLAAHSITKLTEDEAREEKRGLVKAIGELLLRIDTIFDDIKAGQMDSAAATEEKAPNNEKTPATESPEPN